MKAWKVSLLELVQALLSKWQKILNSSGSLLL